MAQRDNIQAQMKTLAEKIEELDENRKASLADHAMCMELLNHRAAELTVKEPMSTSSNLLVTTIQAAQQDQLINVAKAAMEKDTALSGMIKEQPEMITSMVNFIVATTAQAVESEAAAEAGADEAPATAATSPVCIRFVSLNQI